MKEWKDYENEEELQNEAYYYTETIKPIEQKKMSKGKKVIAWVVLIGLLVGTSTGVGVAIGRPLAQNVIKPFLQQFEQAWAFEEEKAETPAVTEKNPDIGSTVSPITSTGEKSPVVEIAKKVSPSVVTVTSSRTMRDWFNNPYNQEGTGSGVIFGEKGDEILIVTNHHVIDQATNVTVTLLGDHTVPAYLKGYDPQTDLAVLYMKKGELPADIKDDIQIATFGDSDELEPGELAVAIGNPLGKAFSHTVTVGVISAINRELELEGKTMTMIQTDAAINPGNSGGALVNGKGEVIGINTVKLVDAKVEGMGFAIPINDAKPIIEVLVNRGLISRPGLGIAGLDIDRSQSELFDIPVGIAVRQVLPGGAADVAGIRQGDLIIAVGDEKIMTMEQLTNILKNHQVGDVVEVTIVRDLSTKHVVKVKLQDIS
ncbi:MAG: trypsin-like serine protease, partial [Epulopiscium sp.]|nr:trypsin-like serine protease [Candidatus Epulonipiscium sp.]